MTQSDGMGDLYCYNQNETIFIGPMRICLLIQMLGDYQNCLQQDFLSLPVQQACLKVLSQKHCDTA